MIQLETRDVTRGVAVLPPPAWSTNPTFVDTLLAGLRGHPLLNPVTASGLFAAVHGRPAAAVARCSAGPGGPSGPAGSAGSAGSTGSADPAGSGLSDAGRDRVGAAASGRDRIAGPAGRSGPPPRRRPARAGTGSDPAAPRRRVRPPPVAIRRSRATWPANSALTSRASWPPATAWPAWWPSCPRMPGGSSTLEQGAADRGVERPHRSPTPEPPPPDSGGHHPGHQPDHAAPLVVDHPHLHQGGHPLDGPVRRRRCTPGWSCG